MLFLAVAEGTFYPVITLTAAKDSAGGAVEFAKWTLSNVVVTAYHAIDGAEEYAFIFTGAEFKYTPTSGDGSAGYAGRCIIFL